MSGGQDGKASVTPTKTAGNPSASPLKNGGVKSGCLAGVLQKSA